MLIAYFAKAPQVRRGCRDISTFPEDRFDQNSSNIFGIYLLGKEQVQLIKRSLDNLFFGRRWGQT